MEGQRQARSELALIPNMMYPPRGWKIQSMNKQEQTRNKGENGQKVTHGWAAGTHDRAWKAGSCREKEKWEKKEGKV